MHLFKRFVLNHANGEIKILNQRKELVCGCKKRLNQITVPHPIIPLNTQISNEYDKTNREINNQQTIRPMPHMFYHISFLYQNVETE